MRLVHTYGTATHCNTLLHTATHCNTLQHTATHCNTLRHTSFIRVAHTWLASLMYTMTYMSRASCVTWLMRDLPLTWWRDLSLSLSLSDLPLSWIGERHVRLTSHMRERPFSLSFSLWPAPLMYTSETCVTCLSKKSHVYMRKARHTMPH